MRGYIMSEDFGFYGDDADNNEEKVINGISGKVTDFTFTNIDYPCIIFKEGFKCPKHQLQVISNMVKTISDVKDVSLYFINNGELFKMGMLSGLQVSSFLEIIGTEKVFGYYNKDIKLEDSKLYTLCSIL